MIPSSSCMDILIDGGKAVPSLLIHFLLWSAWGMLSFRGASPAVSNQGASLALMHKPLQKWWSFFPQYESSAGSAGFPSLPTSTRPRYSLHLCPPTSHVSVSAFDSYRAPKR
jgi:hypothetical protein